MKVVGVVRGPLPHEPLDITGLLAFALHVPAAGTPQEHPDDITGVVTAWIADGASVDPDAWVEGSIDAYEVTERVQVDYERTWPDGTPSPGVRRMSFLHRAEGISREQMSAHWSDVHAPLARLHHPAIWRYVQNTVVRTLTRDAPDIDAVAELHFRSRQDLRDRFYDSDEGRRIIGEDVRRFLDPSRGWRMVAQETWLTS